MHFCSGVDTLVLLEDDEAHARLAAAQAQVDFRKRVRNDQAALTRARKTQDEVADGEKAVIDAQFAVDRAVVAWRTGTGSHDDLEQSRAALLAARDRLLQRRHELHNLEPDLPSPTQVDAQLTIARADLAVVEAAIDKMTIRAPIDGTVLQVTAKQGELAFPAATEALVIIGDLSTLRVRTEVEERDIANIEVDQSVAIRASAFDGREFMGKVASIAPLVKSGKGGARGPRNLTDINIAEVMVDVIESGPLMVGMQADVFFRADKP